MKAALTGPISASTTLNAATTTQVKEAWSKSTAMIRTWGGNGYTGSTHLDFIQHNPLWVRSLNEDRNKWTLCDIPEDGLNTAKGYNENFVPIWELCTNESRKKTLRDAFYSLNQKVEKDLLAKELYVVYFGFTSHKDKNVAINSTPKDCIRVEQDLNQGASGNYVFLHYKLGPKEDTYTNFCLDYFPKNKQTEGKHTDNHDGMTGVEFWRHGQDLNQGAGGDFVYMSGTKDKRFKPVKRLNAITGSISGYDEWAALRWRSRDQAANCNQSQGKAPGIFVILKH